MFDVCVVGSLNCDLVVRAPRLPAAGETLLGGPFARHAGGKGANQAVAAARAGARVALVGCVGADEHGDELLAVLRTEGVDVTHVARLEGVPTGVAAITVAEGGENTIVVAPGATARFGPRHVESAAQVLERAACIVAQLEVPLASVERAFELARGRGVATVLNAAPAQQLPRKLLELTTLLVVNEREARELAGPGSLRELVPALRGLGVRETIVTLGARGAVHVTDERVVEQSSFDVVAVDSTGAGDAFVGALAFGVARGSIELARACAAGALACTRAGAIAALPRRAEVDALLASTAAR